MYEIIMYMAEGLFCKEMGTTSRVQILQMFLLFHFGQRNEWLGFLALVDQPGKKENLWFQNLRNFVGNNLSNTGAPFFSY